MGEEGGGDLRGLGGLLLTGRTGRGRGKRSEGGGGGIDRHILYIHTDTGTQPTCINRTKTSCVFF